MTDRQATLVLVEVLQNGLDDGDFDELPCTKDAILDAIRTLTLDEDYGTENQEAA